MIYSHLSWSQNGGIGCFFQHLPTHWSLLALPGLPALLGLDPSGHQTMVLGSTCLRAGSRFSWLQILPLAPVLPKTTLGFSKMHSSVSYWMNYWSFSYYGSIASVILVFHWLNSSTVALALLLHDTWGSKLWLFIVYIWWDPGFLYHTFIDDHLLPRKDNTCYLPLITVSIP